VYLERRKYKMNEIIHKPQTIGEFFASKKDVIAQALPRHMTPERMLRIVMTEVRRIPKLQKCSVSSLFSAVVQCSLLGLEPGGSLGHAYLIPYGEECQFIIGYRGMLDLARRSGQVMSVSVHEVYSNDKFDYSFGLEEKLEHKPHEGDRGSFWGAYAIVRLKDGAYQFEVMAKNAIEKARNSSKAKNNGPWITHYDEMAKKTVLRRLFKYLPISIEFQNAIATDEAAEIGSQYNIFESEPEEKQEEITTQQSLEQKPDDYQNPFSHQLPAKKADEVASQLNI